MFFERESLKRFLLEFFGGGVRAIPPKFIRIVVKHFRRIRLHKIYKDTLGRPLGFLCDFLDRHERRQVHRKQNFVVCHRLPQNHPLGFHKPEFRKGCHTPETKLVLQAFGQQKAYAHSVGLFAPHGAKNISHVSKNRCVGIVIRNLARHDVVGGHLITKVNECATPAVLPGH